jgi:hypothetical protein
MANELFRGRDYQPELESHPALLSKRNSQRYNNIRAK